MRSYDTQEHRQRVNGGIVDCNPAAAVHLLREGQQGRVGRTTRKQAAHLEEIHLQEQAGDDGHHRHRDQGNHRTVQHPDVTPAYQARHEILSRAQTHGRHKEGDADLPDHQVGTQGRISRDPHLGAKVTQQDGHDERTARQTELQRLRHGGEADGQRTHQHTQGDAKENRNQVRFLQGFGLIAHALRKMADALFRTHDLDAVAHLEDQVGIGLQLNTASQDTRNRHTVFLADVQMAQAMAGNGRFGNGEALRNQFGARFLPLFHVHGQFRTEDDARFILVLDIGNNQQFIPLLQRHIQIREENILAAFHSGNDQVIRVYLPHDIVDRLAEQGGILHPAGKTVGIVILCFDVTETAFAERNRKEFTANVSHELKTPLQSIIGSAELLENGLVKPEDTKRFVGNIKNEATRLVSLINDIIQLSQLDEDSEPATESVDLYDVANEVIEVLTISAAKKQVELYLNGESCVMKGIRRYLYEIIYNLCDNAIRYNKDGGKVAIDLKNAGDNIILSVSDTGIGIPAEHQSRIFERFYRVDKSHSKETGGTGLGLSIVKHAVAYHGGKVTLSSKVGKGTTITVEF